MGRGRYAVIGCGNCQPASDQLPFHHIHTIPSHRIVARRQTPRRRVLALSLLTALWGCSPLPTLHGRSESRALDNTQEARLGRAAAQQQQAHPGQTGALALPEGREAFATRMLLAEAAECSLDVQYYIWHPDLTGSLLMEALHQAADRGVRVRLLLDDNNTQGLDPMLAAVDNQATILGGRNIGDEYFDVGQEVSFIDLDVLAVGKAVPQVSADFDRYWASASAYPVASLLPATG